MLKKLQYSLLTILTFTVPLFFLNLTQEFFVTNKFYLLSIGVLIISALTALLLLGKNKLTYRLTPFDKPFALLIAAYGLSVLITTPNKIHAFLSVPAGFGLLIALTLLYLLLTHIRKHKDQTSLPFLTAVSAAAVIAAVLRIIYVINPLAAVSLPDNLSVIAQPLFTPLGTQFELAILLGFFALVGITKAYEVFAGKAQSIRIKLTVSTFTLVVIFALIATISALVKPDAGSVLPPTDTSWFATIETLKNPSTALFGVGVDNFSSMFTRVKPAAYNLTNLWQVSFNQSRSHVLHIWTETGLFGLAAVLILIGYLLKELITLHKRRHRHARILMISASYLLAIFFLLPPNFTTIFLLVIIFAAVARSSMQSQDSINGKAARYITISQSSIATKTFAITLLILISATVLLLSRTYASELTFKRSLNNLSSGNLQAAYSLSRKAAVLNPYNESFRRSFSQVNLFAAQNVAQKEKPSDQDRTTAANAIQSSIQEAKAAIALNPDRTQNWENLAIIYRNLLTVAQGADAWTIASYNQAIRSDPRNPILRLSLGSVYYSTKNYQQAAQTYAQSVNLKPDWANARYNLAWALFNAKQYTQAAREMQIVTRLVEQGGDDFEKASSDLKDFLKKLPSQKVSTDEAELAPGDKGKDQTPLELPTEPETGLDKPLELPQEAGPTENK